MSISTLGTLFQFIGGLGMFLYGMESMADGLQKFAGNRLQRVLEILTSNRLLGVLVGAGVTAIIQSSSASVGILQMLAINGMVNWQSAVFITLGQNIGTCATALLSCIGTTRTAKRAAVIHLLFNVTGAVVFGVALYIVFMLSLIHI